MTKKQKQAINKRIGIGLSSEEYRALVMLAEKNCLLPTTMASVLIKKAILNAKA